MADQANSSKTSVVPDKPSIGVIYMLSDKTIVVRISLSEGERVGDVTLTISPSHPDYRKALKRVGGLKPDEAKILYEWDMNFENEKHLNG